MFENDNFFTFQEFLNSLENLNKIQKENEIFNKIQKENLCLKNEIENLKKSNENLQYNLNKITKKFENDLNLSFIANNEKDKQIYLLIDALNISENLNKNYKEKIENLIFLLKNNEKFEFFKEIEEKNSLINNLQNELKNKNEIIKNFNKNFSNFSNNLTQTFSNENFDENDFKKKYENEIKKNKELKINIKEIIKLIQKFIDSKSNLKNYYEQEIKNLLKKNYFNDLNSNENFFTFNENFENSFNNNFDEISELKKENEDLKEINLNLFNKIENINVLQQDFQNLFNQMEILKKENDLLKKNYSQNQFNNFNDEFIIMNKKLMIINHFLII